MKSGFMFHSVVQALLRQSVVIVTLISPSPALVRDLAAELRPTDVAVVGYSLGGRLALAIAARHPDLAACVVVVSGNPGLQGVQPFRHSVAYPAHPSAAPVASACCCLTGPSDGASTAGQMAEAVLWSLQHMTTAHDNSL